MRCYKNEFARCLCTVQPWLAFFICLGIYFLGIGWQGWINIILYPSTTWVHQHNGFMMEFNPFRTLLPFPAAFAACNMLIDDHQHKNAIFQVSRLRFGQFCRMKFIVPCCMGGFVLAAGVYVFLGVMAFFVPAVGPGTYFEPFVAEMIGHEQWALYRLYFASLQFLLGFLCAAVGMIVATLTSEKGLVYLSPMLLMAVVEITTNFTIVGLSAGQSALIFRMESESAMQVFLVITAIDCSLIVIAYQVFAYLLRRRIYQWQ